ncbi:MAG: S46 family peptidase [Acidobacteria bacterium]|nr:S46 family peptidase [Acidobacteriota bacterium]
MAVLPEPDHYLKWSENGPVEGELVIVPGFPGSTARLLTAAQLKYQRDTGNPLQMQVWSSRRDALKKYAERGPEQARQASPLRLSLENSIKRLIGQQAGLENPRIFQKKEADEESLRKQIASRADWQKEYSDAWPVIERAYNSLPAMAKRISFSNLTASRLGTLASNIVRLGEEITRPNGERYEEFRDNRLDSLKLSMLSKAPIYPELEMAVLTSWLEEASKVLGGDDPFVRAVLGGKSPAEAVKSAVSSSRLPDPAYRQSLLNGSPDQIARSINQSDDPMLDMARRIEPVIRRLRAWQEENIQNIETRANEKIARARFAVYGKNLYPDANFNLRITYGTVAGYEEDTTLVPYKTTFYGLYDRAISFGEKAPYHLPARFKERREKVNLQTPLDFVYSADTIGGNSGSPVINRRGELVGINFDSNIQKLPNRYLYIDENEGARAVGVHSSAIIEALNNVYGAGLLVRELLGR